MSEVKDAELKWYLGAEKKMACFQQGCGQPIWMKLDEEIATTLWRALAVREKPAHSRHNLRLIKEEPEDF